jgi:hypothetical protein
MFYRIKRWLRFDAPYLHKEIIQGIKNLIRWFPTIWKDRDWDDHYIWEILKVKLKNQSTYIGRYDRHLSAKRDAEIMMTCVRLIDKIQTEFYQMEYSNYYETEFHLVDCEDRPDYKQLKIEYLSENFDEYFKIYPRIYKQVINAEKTIFRIDDKSGIAMNMAHINHQRALKLLFKIMEDNILKWWD